MGDEMRESKLYCDVCRKEIKGKYYHINTNCTDCYITAMPPNSLLVDLCSKECIIQWVKKDNEVAV